jgi:hypothetical protein
VGGDAGSSAELDKRERRRRANGLGDALRQRWCRLAGWRYQIAERVDDAGREAVGDQRVPASRAAVLDAAGGDLLSEQESSSCSSQPVAAWRGADAGSFDRRRRCSAL